MLKVIFWVDVLLVIHRMIFIQVIMRRAERKLQLSNNVVGQEDETSVPGKDTGVESGDMQSLIFGLRIFDSADMNTGNMSQENVAKLNAMAEKVVEIRNSQHLKEGSKFEINQKDLFDRNCHLTTNVDFYNFESGLDEASYLSWVEKFKEESKSSESSMLELGKRRNLSEERDVKREANKKKAEDKRMEKWESLGYQSLAVKQPDLVIDSTILSDSGSVQYVYGDCTKPEKVRPSEPAIIFRYVL